MSSDRPGSDRPEHDRPHSDPRDSDGSDAEAPDKTGPAPADPRPVPDADRLARVAEPATVRRAPRYRAFVLSGVVVGAVVALVLVLTLGGGDRPEETGVPDVGSGPVLVFTALTLCLLGALLGGLVALFLDRRSRR